MMVISVIFTLLFAILDSLSINNIGSTQAFVDYLHALFILPTYLLFKNKKLTLTVTANIFLFFCFMTSIAALLTASNDTFRAVWFFLSTIIAFMFGGKTVGRYYGGLAFICIFSAGFLMETNLNSTSIISSLIAFIILTLVMSSFTGQIQKHLNYIDKIQQELNYLANKSAISNAITADEDARKAEKLLKQALKSGDDFAMFYIDIDHCDQLKASLGNATFQLLKEQISEKIFDNLGKNDVKATIDQAFVYIVSPYVDEFGARQFAKKVQKAIEPLNYIYGSDTLNVSISISVALLTAQDTSIRSLHIRADQGLIKAKTSGSNQVILVEA
jgi:diguanylate cyclase (GGDEF)-like protein